MSCIPKYCFLSEVCILFPFMLKFCFDVVHFNFLFLVVFMLLNCCLGGVVHVCLLLLYFGGALS